MYVRDPAPSVLREIEADVQDIAGLIRNNRGTPGGPSMPLTRLSRKLVLFLGLLAIWFVVPQAAAAADTCAYVRPSRQTLMTSVPPPRLFFNVNTIYLDISSSPREANTALFEAENMTKLAECIIETHLRTAPKIARDPPIPIARFPDDWPVRRKITETDGNLVVLVDIGVACLRLAPTDRIITVNVRYYRHDVCYFLSMENDCVKAFTYTDDVRKCDGPRSRSCWAGPVTPSSMVRVFDGTRSLSSIPSTAGRSWSQPGRGGRGEHLRKAVLCGSVAPEKPAGHTPRAGESLCNITNKVVN
jgi:hypothetical protein